MIRWFDFEVFIASFMVLTLAGIIVMAWQDWRARRKRERYLRKYATPISRTHLGRVR